MIELSDEILNNYIDDELDQYKLSEVREQFKNSESDRLRLAMLQRVHRELGKLESFEVSGNFTSIIMSKLQKKSKVVRKDRFFMVSISSIFFIILLAVMGYLFIMSFNNAGGSTQNVPDINNYFSIITNVSSSIKGLMTPKNISIIGSILSFCIIITGYLFFENQRQAKRNLSKLP
ncbi:MAG: hypothetical protein ABR980_04990 [Ignavibacteriaceae bacterium]